MTEATTLPSIDGWRVDMIEHPTQSIFVLVRTAGDFEFSSPPLPEQVVGKNLLRLLAKHVEKGFGLGYNKAKEDLQTGADDVFARWLALKSERIVAELNALGPEFGPRP